MQSRRSFLKEVGLLGFCLGAGLNPLDAFAGNSDKLVILHTNDTHSRIDPFDSGKYKGMGGVQFRKAVIDQIRQIEKNVLLLDAGDIFQGTPYFNLYGGEVELKAMSTLAYDVATLGNHDFDAGVEGLIKQLPHATFDFVNVNYNLSQSPLLDHVKPYKIFDKGNIRVGVIGVGIELDGLVPKKLFGDIAYQDPIETAEAMAFKLKQEEHCDLVICLSHLGYSYGHKKVSDLQLGENSSNIDIILGGHTHTFLNEPTKIKNKKNNVVLVNQVGWGGINLGRIDVVFSKIAKRKTTNSSHVNISEKTIAN